MVDARAINRGVWWGQQDSPRRGNWFRTLVGIGPDEAVSIILPDGKKHPLVDDQVYIISGDIQIVPR